MESLPVYEGKPTAYLDHNILDLFVKHGLDGLGDFGSQLITDYQVVYSDETLKEIRRSKGSESEFLSVLDALNASHIKLVVEQPGFIVTNKAMIWKRNPFEVYDEYCLNSSGNAGIEDSIQQWLFKFSGGRKGDSISDIHNEQLADFSDLMRTIIDNSDSLPPEVKKQLSIYTEEMTFQFEDTLRETEKMLKKGIPDDRNWNGIKDFRNNVGLGPLQLNNIEPPNVLVKIWEQLKGKLPESDIPLDIDGFFLLNKNPIYPDKPYYKHQKVAGIYNMLNTLGYYPDSNVHKERRFVAAWSDNSHASIASFCNVLLSNDEKFIKKVSAAYEYLGISTAATHVIINYVKR